MGGITTPLPEERGVVIDNQLVRVQFIACSLSARQRLTLPHGELRPFHQKSTCLTQLTLGPYVMQIWPRNTPESGVNEFCELHPVGCGIKLQIQPGSYNSAGALRFAPASISRWEISISRLGNDEKHFQMGNGARVRQSGLSFAFLSQTGLLFAGPGFHEARNRRGEAQVPHALDPEP